LKLIIADVRDQAAMQDNYVPLGMLLDWNVQHSAHTKVCLSTDGIGRLLFTLEPLRDRTLAVKVQDVDDPRFGQSCADVVSVKSQASRHRY
jgi:hypothetical protein